MCSLQHAPKTAGVRPPDAPMYMFCPENRNTRMPGKM